jgi:hypothetical protein
VVTVAVTVSLTLMAGAKEVERTIGVEVIV